MKLGVMAVIYVGINSLHRPQLAEGHNGVKSNMATISLHTCYFINYTT